MQDSSPPRFDLDEQPFIVIWEVTRACALACTHCRASATQQRHPFELNTSEAFAFIEQVARAKPALFVLTGGDPVLRSDLLLLVSYAAEKGLRVALSPSATPRLLQADFHRLKQLGVARMSLSIDGASRQSHDAFRGVPGTWNWTFQALAKAAEAEIAVQINTTFTRRNLHEFDGFVALLATIKPVLWSVFQLVPTGRAAASEVLSADEMEGLFVRLHALSLTVPYDIKTTEGHHYRRVVVQRSGNTRAARQRAPLGINDGKGFVFISHTGEIHPSGFLPLPAGNVRRHELIEVYRRNPLFTQLRDTRLLKGKCGICEFKNICGGSRARAYAMTGDFLAEEPCCNYQPRRSQLLEFH
jgi:radical SAM protein